MKYERNIEESKEEKGVFLKYTTVPLQFNKIKLFIIRNFIFFYPIHLLS